MNYFLSLPTSTNFNQNDIVQITHNSKYYLCKVQISSKFITEDFGKTIQISIPNTSNNEIITFSSFSAQKLSISLNSNPITLFSSFPHPSLANLLKFAPFCPNCSYEIGEISVSGTFENVNFLTNFTVKKPEKQPIFTEIISMNPQVLKQLQQHIRQNIIISGPNSSGRTTLAVELAKSMNSQYKIINNINNIQSYINFNGIIIFKNLEKLTPQRNEFSTPEQLTNTTKLLKFLHPENPFYSIAIVENANKLDHALRRNGRFGAEILKFNLNLEERKFILKVNSLDEQIADLTQNYTKQEMVRICEALKLNGDVKRALQLVKHAENQLEVYVPKQVLPMRNCQFVEKIVENFKISTIKEAEKYKLVSQNVLISGSSGSGKSVLISNSLSQLSSYYTIFQLKLQKILSMYVGESEQNLRDLFRVLRQKSPSILVIENVDQVFGQRTEESNGRLLTALLTEIDGARNNDGVFVIGTSIGRVDSALERFGRFGIRIRLGEDQEDEDSKVEGE